MRWTGSFGSGARRVRGDCCAAGVVVCAGASAAGAAGFCRARAGTFAKSSSAQSGAAAYLRLVIIGRVSCDSF
jgi:hypothetical protein